MQRETQSSFKRLTQLLRPHMSLLVAAVAMLFGLALVNMLIPAFIKLILDRVFPNRDWQMLGLVLLGILGVYIGRNILFFCSKSSAVSIGENVCFSLRNRLFEHLQRLNLQFYRKSNPGRLSSRVMDDTFVVQSFIQEQLPKVLQAMFLFVALVAVIYAVNWKLALASTVVLPLHLYTFVRFKRSIKQASSEAQEQVSSVYGSLIEKFLGIEVVKGFGAEQREHASFQEAADLSRRSQKKSKTYHVMQKVAADLLVGLGTIFLLGVGAYEVMGPSRMQPGTFMMFFGYVTMLYPTVLELMSGFAHLARVTASVDRVFEMLQTQDAEAPAAIGTASQRPQMEGRVRFEHVYFDYGDDKPVLCNICLEVEPGQVCAIVGPSGAGKSTMVSMVPRLTTPTSGRLLIDGIDAREWELGHLRSNVGIAFQECFLFNSSVLENLRYARPEATLEQIVSLARRTGAHQMIQRLPEGYDTRLGEGGVTLSRGEKQRLALTRAMLKDPQILVLDEATVSIDAASEARLVPSILEFMKGKTTLLVTHRLDLLRHADVVVQLMEGQVIYHGKPRGVDVSVLERRERSSRGDRRDRSGIWRAMGVALALTAGMWSGGPTLAQDQAPAEQPKAQQKDKQAKNQKAQEPVAPTEAEGAAKSATSAPEPEGLFLAQPGVSTHEAEELLQVVAARVQGQLGYQAAADPDAFELPSPPREMRTRQVMVKQDQAGQHVLELGYVPFTSQPLHVWIYGQTTRPDGQVVFNDAIEQAKASLEQAVKGLDAEAADRTVADLEQRKILLSYVEVDRALGLLKAMGYNVVEFKPGGKSVGTPGMIEPNGPMDLTRLPVVVPVPATDSAGKLPEKHPMTASAPMTELLVFYDPQRPRQFAELRHIVRNIIDVPARQIVIEAMVLEISESGLKRLGVEWELQPLQGSNALENIQTLVFGRLPNFRAGEDATLNLEVDDIFGHFRAQLQALLRTGQAEVLSRPSVLTLDNRQAFIRVGEDIPIATTVSGMTSGDKLSFNFKYVPVGIALSVRPRVTAEAEEISMQVDAQVSSEVPGQDLVIFDNQGNELARAPRISRREVQTYTRIANNTPFIIGGLVSRDIREQLDKVPLLGDLPLLGGLFRNTSVDSVKREVIIVITPFVLPEEQVVGRNLPKDDDAFDSFGNQLFRDAYRIRSGDVFDLSFLHENGQLQRMQRLADRLGRYDVDLAQSPPFGYFFDGRLPGEEILVYRQMYEVIKRKDLSAPVNPDRLILFEADPTTPTGYKVSFLMRKLEKLLGAGGFEQLGGRCVAITWTMPRPDEPAVEQVVPEVRLIPCESKQAWSRTLWELNQPTPDGRPRHTVLLGSESDFTRLERAIVLKRTIGLNATSRTLTLDNFTVGQLLLVPDLKPDQVHLIDEEVARLFFQTEQYYPALQQRLSKAIEAMKRALDRPEVERMLAK